MVALGGYVEQLTHDVGDDSNRIIKLTRNARLPTAMRDRYGFIVPLGDTEIPLGFALCIRFDDGPLGNVGVVLPPSLHYLDEGDIIKIGLKSKQVRVLYRQSSKHNFFLITERCNHYCLMCSQPPKDVQDDWLAQDMLETIPLIDRNAAMIGITGGEPTLLGEKFLNVVRSLKSYLPNTGVHVLSNGRAFSDNKFSAAYAGIRHPNITVGIPIYSDIPSIHDYVVQADNAFDETIRGILALKQLRQKVEIRVVIHKKTYKRLPQLAEFLFRNLAFVDHIALMGLELTGFAKANIETLWIDPADYRFELSEAASFLNKMGMNVSIYNHQLCTVDKKVWNLTKRSISDWKNEYEKACEPCSERERCGGFFTTSRLRRSAHIQPILSHA